MRGHDGATMTYHAAILGARRGLHHAKAYEGLAPRMRVVALCEADPERRAEAAEATGQPVYADYGEMLERERPDIVHAVTSPLVPRATWVEPAARAGVKVLVIEKPLALRPSEAAALLDVSGRTGLKIAVNHQRRSMPFADALLDLLADDEAGLGHVQFVRASTYGRVMDMSTHLLDLALLALGDARPTHVWATAEGYEEHAWYPGPRQMFGTFTFRNGARALYEASPAGEPPFGSRTFAFDPPKGMPAYGPHRMQLDVWADRGRFWWREWGTWGYEVRGQSPFSAPAAFYDDDLPAQRAFTSALADWIEGVPHRCRLEVAALGFEALQGALRSALLGRRLAFPEAARLTDWEQEELLKRLADDQHRI